MQTQTNANNAYNPGKNKLTCPPDLQDRYQAALKTGQKFLDNEFPANLSSIGDTSKFKFGW